MGGFIRIGRVPLQDLIYQDILAKINTETTFDDFRNIIHYLYKREIIKKREAALMLQTISVVFDKLKPDDRVELMKSLILTLANFA